MADLHRYGDGIEEADNDLPRWWVWIFYLTVAFSTLYWLYYHEHALGPTSGQEYVAEAAAARQRSESATEVTDESLELRAHDAAFVAAGKTLFTANCAGCHGTNGEGRIGPNLTDSAWLHGGTPSAIHRVVARGSPVSKTMPAWTPMLGAGGVEKVVAYVLTLRGTNVPGKAPEGRPVSRAPATSATTAGR